MRRKGCVVEEAVFWRRKKVLAGGRGNSCQGRVAGVIVQGRSFGGKKGERGPNHSIVEQGIQRRENKREAEGGSPTLVEGNRKAEPTRAHTSRKTRKLREEDHLAGGKFSSKGRNRGEGKPEGTKVIVEKGGALLFK